MTPEDQSSVKPKPASKGKEKKFKSDAGIRKGHRRKDLINKKGRNGRYNQEAVLGGAYRHLKALEDRHPGMKEELERETKLILELEKKAKEGPLLDTTDNAEDSQPDKAKKIEEE